MIELNTQSHINRGHNIQVTDQTDTALTTMFDEYYRQIKEKTEYFINETSIYAELLKQKEESDDEVSLDLKKMMEDKIKF